MSAELTIVEGKAQMFSGSAITPWHVGGYIMKGNPSYEDVMANKFGCINYPVLKKPYLYPDGDLNVESKDAFYTYRPDTGDILGTVGKQYEVVPNEVAFLPLKPLVDSGIMVLETGGSLRKGADAWLLAKWNLSHLGPEAQKMFTEAGDEVQPYVTVMANHSGRRQTLFGMTPVRIVCSNTLGAAEVDKRSRWIGVPHTSGAKERLLEAAEQMLSTVIERYEVLAAHFRTLKACILSEQQFAEMVIDVLCPDPLKNPKFNPEAKLASVVLERANRKRTEVRRLWEQGKGHTGEHNAWFALNAAVEAIDHNRELWPTRAGSWRTASLLDGQLAAMKNRVTDNLVSFALAA